MIRNSHKRLLVVAFVLSLLSITVQAAGNEEVEPFPHYEFRLSMGLNGDHHLKHENEAFNDKYGLSKSKEDDAISSVGLSFEYFYHFSRKLSVGACIGFATADGNGGKITGGKYDEDGNLIPAKRVIDGKTYYFNSLFETDTESHSFYFMPEAKYTWYQTRRIGLYSKAGLGIRHYRFNLLTYYDTYGIPEKHERKWQVCYQLSPIGVEVGGKHFKFFTEAGYGSQAVLDFGVVYKL